MDDTWESDDNFSTYNPIANARARPVLLPIRGGSKKQRKTARKMEIERFQTIFKKNQPEEASTNPDVEEHRDEYLECKEGIEEDNERCKLIIGNMNADWVALSDIEESPNESNTSKASADTVKSSTNLTDVLLKEEEPVMEELPFTPVEQPKDRSVLVCKCGPSCPLNLVQKVYNTLPSTSSAIVPVANIIETLPALPKLPESFPAYPKLQKTPPALPKKTNPALTFDDICNFCEDDSALAKQEISMKKTKKYVESKTEPYVPPHRRKDSFNLILQIQIEKIGGNLVFKMPYNNIKAHFH